MYDPASSAGADGRGISAAGGEGGGGVVAEAWAQTPRSANAVAVSNGAAERDILRNPLEWLERADRLYDPARELKFDRPSWLDQPSARIAQSGEPRDQTVEFRHAIHRPETYAV